MFPFKFESKTYSTCTNRLKDKTNHLPWCSTKVDKKGRHISSRGNWGNCDKTCPLPPDDKNNSDEKGTNQSMLVNMYS